MSNENDIYEVAEQMAAVVINVEDCGDHEKVSITKNRQTGRVTKPGEEIIIQK